MAKKNQPAPAQAEATTQTDLEKAQEKALSLIANAKSFALFVPNENGVICIQANAKDVPRADVNNAIAFYAFNILGASPAPKAKAKPATKAKAKVKAPVKPKK